MLERLVFKRLSQGEKSVILLGPRQVGKSTLVRSLSPNLYINLADEEVFFSYSKDPGRLKREILVQKNLDLVVLDEIQRIPSLLNTVQVLIDEKIVKRVILTGSSARKLKQRGANLLPGRVILEYLDPISIWEFENNFDLEKVLRIGSLPGVILDEKYGQDILASYATIYLKEEVQAEALLRNIGSYARFLDVAAEASGEWINYSKLSSDAAIPLETMRRFFSVLEETLLIFRIPSFRVKKSKRRVSQKDRFVFFDLGVRNALLGIHGSNLSPTEKGKLFEQWVILECLRYIRANKKNWELSSYRTEKGAEVDIILDVGKKIIGIECKYGKNVSEAQMRGLRSFEEISHKPFEKYVVYQGTAQKFSKGELALPYEEFFLKVLPQIG